MKQRILIDQLNELTDEQKLKLQEWWQPQEGDCYTFHFWNDKYSKENFVECSHGFNKEDIFPLLSIGQMIELLSENNYPVISESPTKWVVFHEIDNVKDYEMAEELCDALWNVVKKVL